MSTITTRSGKGSPLTNNEVDNNFTNLNTDKAELSGATFTGEIVANGGIALGDNDKATFGSGDDLQLFHNGTDSYVYDNGTGNLILQGSAAVYIQAAGTSENMATFSKDGNVTLYHNGIAKLATTSTGIDVTGTATMDGLTVDGGATTTLKAGGFTSNSEAILELAENRDGSNNLLYGFKFKTDGAGDNNFHLLRHSNSTTGNKALSVGRDNGDISFYEDTGTTPKLTWSASGEDLNFADSVKATFGAGDDLKLYHTGAHSYIDESGTGNLYIGSNNGAGVYIQGSGETLASFVDNGAVTLYHDNAVKLATTSTGIDVTGTLNVSEDVLLGSNGRIRVGSVGSLSSPTIYLDTDPNTGIYFPSTDSVGFVAGGVERLTVNNTGIDVTGTATMDGLTVDGDGLIQASTGAKLEIKSTTNFINPNDVVGSLDFVSADYNYSAQPIKGQIRSVATNPSGTGESALFLSTTETTNLKDRIKIDYNGDISFYEDTGTTPKFFWDASAEKLGIGTSSPDTVLHLAKSSAATLRLESTATALATGGVLGAIEFESNDTGSQSGVNAKINSVFTNTVGATSLQFFTSDSFAVVDSTPKMVINNVGNVGIGTSSPSAVIDTVSSGTNSQSIAKFSSASGKRAEISTDAQDDAFMYLYDSADAVKVAFRTDGNASYINGGGNVGIGTVTPVTLLDVAGENPVLTLRDSRGSGSWTAGTELGKIDFRTSDGTGIGAHSIASIGVVAGGANAASPDGELVFATGPYNTVSQERMRIDSSGNLLVGTTSTDPNSTAGAQLAANGRVLATVDGSNPGYFNRLTSDGELVRFEKDGTSVGSIGVGSGALGIGKGSGNLGLFDNFVVPMSTIAGGGSNGNITLGNSGRAFKDLYLSGGVYLGGTGAANKLDDYESGTFTPVFSFGGNSVGVTYQHQVGSYVKVGDLVTAQIFIQLLSKGTSTGELQVSGLPFTTYNLTTALHTFPVRLKRISYVGSPTGYADTNVSFLRIEQVTEAGVNTKLTNANCPDNAEIMITFTYRTN